MDKLFSLFLKFSIKMRVMSMGGIAILGFVVILTTDLVTSFSIETALVSAENNKKLELTRTEMLASSLLVRRREKDFFLRLDKEYIASYNKDMDATIVLLKKANGLSDKPAVNKAASELETVFKQHKAQFKRVSDLWIKIGLDTKSGLYADMQDAVHGIETELPKYKIDPLIIKMLMMRRHEKDFMMRVANKDSDGNYSNGPKYAERIDTRTEEFMEIVKASNITPSGKADLEERLMAYVSAFQGYAQYRMQLVDETAKLSAIYKESDAHFVTLKRVAQAGILEAAEAYEATDSFSTLATYIAAAIFGIWSVVAVLVVVRTTIPALKGLEHTLGVLAGGNYDVDVQGTNVNDEIGNMARAVLVLRDNGKKQRELEAEMAKLEEESAREEAEKLKREQEQERRATEEEAVRVAEQESRAERVRDLISSFDQVIQASIGDLESSAGQMQGTATNMVDVADNTGRQAASVSEASEQMDTNVSTMAAVIEEFSQSIREANGQVQSATKLSEGAVSTSEEGAASIEKLSDASKTIEKVVNLISDIAEQTNLLALNATIEAARAGDAGRGFAVVAGEVKNLATQTAKATEDITKQINEMQALSGGAVASMGSIRDANTELNQTMLSISAAIEEQEAATGEISRNVQFTAEGTQRVTSEIGQVAANVDMTKSSSSEVMAASTQLEGLAASIKEEVQSFLNDVQSV